MNKPELKMQEWDKRMGIPEFKGWEQREVEAFKKSGLTWDQYLNGTPSN